MESLRIIRIESADICFEALKNQPLIIKNGKDEFNDYFSDILPPNLDLYYLESLGKLKTKSLGDEQYTYDLINVSFKYPLYIDKNGDRVYPKDVDEKADYQKITASEIRRNLYLYGFTVNGKEYVRYKRSSGAAKSGGCLFIKKDLYRVMNEWSKTGLDENKDLCYKSLTSYEAYRALSLSSVITTLDLNPYNILFVKDAEVTLKDQEVIKVYHDKSKGLLTEDTKVDVINNVFDGEGLLDVSVFKKNHKVNKGMMLLRSRFFKCCAFNTNLQKWFKDNNITKVEQLNGITFANSIEDIVLVASESCLKYLKMCNGGFNKENIKRWCDQVNQDRTKFGVVKTDKPTRFFNGEMVETTYQLLNSLQLSHSDVNRLIVPYINYILYIRDIRRTPEFIRFYLEGEDDGNEEKEYDDETEDANDEEIAKEILKYSSYSFKNKICLELTKIDGDIKYTNLFKKRVFGSIIDSLLLKLYNGRVLVNGTYATLFGNPYQYLEYIILGKDGKPLFDKDNPTSLLKDGEICCSFFEEKELIGSRAPHTTMGNVLYARNKKLPEIDKYFNLSKQIVVVDSVNNNIQHRLSGCDFDSDLMLLSDNPVLVDAAKANYSNFKVPYTGFASTNKKMKKLSSKKKENLLLNLIDIDNEISNNVVGKIVNLSQLLNSQLWNKYNKNKHYDYSNLYSEIAILSVLSGADIDSAKRSFPFSTVREYNRVKKYAKDKKLSKDKPLFFTILSKSNDHKPKISKIKQLNDRKREFKTSMDYLWEIVNDSRFVDDIRTKTIKFFDLIKHNYRTKNIPGDVYRQIDAASTELGDIKDAIDDNDYSNKGDFELKKVNFNSIVKKAFKKLKNNINSVTKAKLLLKTLEDLDDGYSKSFLLLYLISKYHRELGYSLRDLFSSNAKPLPSLRQTKSNEKPQYELFNKYHYNKTA